MLAIIKKELKGYFLSPIGYVVIGIFLIAYSGFFYLTTIQSSSVDMTNLFYNTALWGLMFIVPLLTMWTISGERKSGTEQLIMTSPVSMLGVVIAKFLSALLLIVIPVIFTLMYFAILCKYQMPDINTYLTSALGFILLSMSYISFGVFASSLTETPIVAGILTFGFVFGTTILPQLITSIDISSISLLNLFIKFLLGQIDISATVIFISLTILCIMITMIIMQRRKSIK